jgi:hypothetical protein
MEQLLARQLQLIEEEEELLRRQRQQFRPNNRRNLPAFRYNPTHREDEFSFPDPVNCERWCRFTPAEIRQLAALLLGDDFSTTTSKRHYHCEPEEAMYLVAKRLAWPARLYDIGTNFGRGGPYCSEVINETIAYLYNRWNEHLKWWPALDDRQTLQTFADAYGHGLWGAVDGTFVPICRPSDPVVQRWTYSGYYRLNGIKFQCITAPNGLIVSVSDPFFGPVNDFTIWDRSGVIERLRQIMDGDWLFLLGDSAYFDTEGIVSTIRRPQGVPLDDEAREFNEVLANLRIIVEDSFGETVNQETYIKFKGGLRLGKQPVGAYYAIATLLKNCRSCMRRDRPTTVNVRFGLRPPAIEDYLRGVMA